MKEKKELIILTNTCFPICSATGAISLKYAKYLKKNYNIRVISVQEGDYKLTGKLIDGNKHYTITQFFYKYFAVFEQKSKKSSGILKIIYKFLSITCKLVRFFERKCVYIDNRWWYVKKSGKLLDKLWEEKKFDSILSISSPIGSHVAALKFKEKHPEVFWVSYWGDLFSGKNFKQNIFIPLKCNVNLEDRILSESDYVITTDEIYEKFITRINKNKIQNMHYTLNDDVLEKDIKRNQNDTINLICMGSFNSKVRNPEYMLSIFSKLKINFNLNLYTNGCDKIIQKYENSSIKLCGKIPYVTLQEHMMSCDYLINVGNSISTSVPSKLLELISYRKPIIDFYYPNNRNQLLDNYPLSYRIKIDTIDEKIIEQLEEYLKENKNNYVELNYIKNNFYEYLECNVESIIIEIFKKGVE